MHTPIMFTCRKCGEQYEALISIDEFEANERTEMILCRDCQREEEIESEKNDIFPDDDYTNSNLMVD